MRIILGLLVLLLMLLNYQLWLAEDQGVRRVARLQAAVTAQRQDNSIHAERNRVLEAEVKSLKAGLDAIEERARLELGMIHRDETFYWVLDEMPTPAEPPVTSASHD